MSTYVALANYTERGIQHIRESPSRLDAVRRQLEEMGGAVRSFYLTLGEYDIVFVYDAPDDAISSRFLLLLGRRVHPDQDDEGISGGGLPGDHRLARLSRRGRLRRP